MTSLLDNGGEKPVTTLPVMQCSPSVINPSSQRGCGRTYRIDAWKRPALAAENELGLVGSGYPHHGSHSVGTGSGWVPPGELADISLYEEGYSTRCQDEGTWGLLH